jgi:hypothetical protein
MSFFANSALHHGLFLLKERRPRVLNGSPGFPTAASPPRRGADFKLTAESGEPREANVLADFVQRGGAC